MQQQNALTMRREAEATKRKTFIILPSRRSQPQVVFIVVTKLHRGGRQNIKLNAKLEPYSENIKFIISKLLIGFKMQPSRLLDEIWI